MTTAVQELNEPQRGWRYHSGSTLFTERFRDGRLVFAALQDTGVPFKPAHEESGNDSFALQIDGDTLASGWELAESGIVGDGTRLLLRHMLKPVDLEIRTDCGGDGFLRRRMRLRNRSATATLGLSSVTPMCGGVWAMGDNLRDNLHESGAVPYRVGWMQDVEWGHEGNFQWQHLPLNSELAFGSRRGRSGHTTPFAIAQNLHHGGYLVAGLAWSANWRMSFACDYSRGGCCNLRFAMQPTGPAPMRLLAPGEAIDLPEVHVGMNHVSFDDAVQCWHAYLRRHVLCGDAAQPVIYNHWGYMEHELSEPALMREIDTAAAIGAELFMVDAGWYADAGTPWYDTSGDWQAGNRLPNDLFPVFAHARSKGLLCGLWVEVESAGKCSRLAKEHPDWFITRHGKAVERVLDLAKPEVRDHVEATIIRLIGRYQLDMFRLDYNLDAWEGGYNPVDGRLENTLWRHVEAIHAIFDRVRARFPRLQLENCSSGGGRTDLGMMERFTTTWISDWMRMPRTVRILNGMSMALPPELLNRTFGVVMEGSYRGNPDTQLHAIVLGHPTISGLGPNLDETNSDLLRATAKYLAIYKDFIRPFHRQSRIFHHTPVIPGADGSGWCALEIAAIDRSRIAAGIFRLVNAGQDEHCLRLRGADPGRTYRVTSEPDGMVMEIEGHILAQQGLIIRLDSALTSRLVLCQAL